MDELRDKHAKLTGQINKLRDERRKLDRQIRRKEFFDKHGVSKETYYRRKRQQK